MLRCLLAGCISVAAMPAAQAQTPSYVEPSGFSLGMNIGLSDLWGDVGTQSPIDHYANERYWEKAHFMGGMYIRYSAHPALAFRLGANYGTLYANDDFNYTKAQKAATIEDDAYQRYLRNQKVRANVWEPNFMIELTPFRFSPESKLSRRRMQPYLMAGFSFFHFKPQGEYVNRITRQTQWMDLRDLHLEGEGFKIEGAPEQYELWQYAVPLSLGVRWDIGENLGLGVEYTYRMTFTDYLDGVSDRYIDPALFDLYLPEAKAVAARDMYDRSWLINEGASHMPGELRGNKSVNDGFSTISVTLFYRFTRRLIPWWF
jgi:opacity protein-like surface antigen